MTTLQKVIKYCAMAFAAFLAVSIIGGIVGALTLGSFIFDKRQEAGEMQAYAVNDKVVSLKADISAADFVIQSGDTFSVVSNHSALTVENDRGCLVISEKKRLWHGAVSEGVTVTLTVPADTAFETADITTGAGRMTVDTLRCDTLMLELGAGEVSIGELTAAVRAEIEGGAGKFTVRDGALSELDLDMGVGEVNLRSRLAGDCDLSCGVGEVNLTLLGASADYTVEAEKGLGSITVDGRSVRNEEICGNGPNRVDIDGGVGAVTVEFEG